MPVSKLARFYQRRPGYPVHRIYREREQRHFPSLFQGQSMYQALLHNDLRDLGFAHSVGSYLHCCLVQEKFKSLHSSARKKDDKCSVRVVDLGIVITQGKSAVNIISVPACPESTISYGSRPVRTDSASSVRKEFEYLQHP